MDKTYGIIVLLIVALVVFLSLTSKSRKYNRTEYAKVTGLKLKEVQADSGRSGEYLTYKELREVPGYKRFLFNCLVPKQDGTTTEIDVLMIHTSGLYVFECKNYKGWIFGNESQRTWTQALSNGRGKEAQREHFYNPMMQNAAHMRWLKEFLADVSQVYPHSYVVFGNGCSFKSITQTSRMHRLLHVSEVKRQVSADAKMFGTLLSKEEVNKLYDKLYPLTQKTEAERAEHVRQIKSGRKSASYAHGKKDIGRSATEKTTKPSAAGEKEAPAETTITIVIPNKKMIESAKNAAPWAAYSKKEEPEEKKTVADDWYATPAELEKKKKPSSGDSSAATGIPPWRR